MDWSCEACTYVHRGEEAAFLTCAVCGAVARDCSTQSDFTPAMDAGVANAAALLAASRAVDTALATRETRDAASVHSSMASRIAQQRQARQAQREAEKVMKIQNERYAGAPEMAPATAPQLPEVEEEAAVPPAA